MGDKDYDYHMIMIAVILQNKDKSITIKVFVHRTILDCDYCNCNLSSFDE